MPKRVSVDDYFAQLNDRERPHLSALRDLSRAADDQAVEMLKWNLPMYVRDEKNNLWMLQNFKNHCSLRFSPAWFGDHRAEVEAAGCEPGEGFVKLPYDRELPHDLVVTLLAARVADYAAGWTPPAGPKNPFW